MPTTDRSAVARKAWVTRKAALKIPHRTDAGGYAVYYRDEVLAALGKKG